MAWESSREDMNVYSQGEIDKWVYSTCNICSNGCGCFIAVKDDKIVGIKGNKDYPINHGRLGPKGENQWWANTQLRPPVNATYPQFQRGTCPGILGRCVRPFNRKSERTACSGRT